MPYSSVEAKSIQELCRVIDCEHKTAPYIDHSDYLVVRTSNVRNGQLLMEDMKYTTQAGFEEWSQRATPEYGDVLFTREAPAGESCLVPKDKKICMGQRMVLLRPNRKKVDPLFLSLILATEKCKFDILRLSIGSTVSRINISDIKKLRVAAPPLLEQTKIAKILSAWDNAINTTEKLLANSQLQKKALMQQLLTGKKRLLDKNGKQFNAKWKSASLGKTCKFLKGYTYKSSEYSEVPTEYGFLTLKSILRGGGYSSPGIKFLTAPADDKFSVQEGDLIFAITDLTRNAEVVGAPILVPNLPHTKVFISMDLIKLEPSENVNKIYLFYLLKLPENRNFMRARASGSTVLHLDVSGVKKLSLNLPCFEEQQKIAAVLSVVDEKIATIQKRIDSLVQGKKALMQQLLTGKRRVKIN